MENIVLKASDGYALSLAVFEREHPRGYIQIIHGMEEHKERYEAFAEQLRQAGEFTNLKGLIYFTDGFGTFPERQSDYHTAFVFIDNEYNNTDVPIWAIKLILQKDEI